MPVLANIVSWRAKSGNGWSSTICTGLAFDLDGESVLVTELSDELHVLPRIAEVEYKFVDFQVTRDLSDSFVESVRQAYRVNQELQSKLPDFQSKLEEFRTLLGVAKV